MPQPCKCCTHPKRVEIDNAIADNGTADIVIATEYGMSRESVRRHRKNHMAIEPDSRVTVTVGKTSDYVAALDAESNLRRKEVAGWLRSARPKLYARSAKSGVRTHVVIPDTQQKVGVPNAHMSWIGQFIADEYASADLVIVHIGDHWDMPSLSSYDSGKKAMEGRRYVQDIAAGNAAFDLLNAPLAGINARRVFTLGNHEQRIVRAAESDAQLEGLITLDHLNIADWGWEVHDFLAPVTVDGVTYAHYFANPMTGRPYSGGNLETRLKTVGHSFTMGHQQGLKWGRVDTIRGPHIGLVAGSCYIHDEDYLGPQCINYWRGIVVKHQVEDGSYDPMPVSLDYLCRRYEGKPLADMDWEN